MKKHIVAKCTKCGKALPITDPVLWVNINIELKEAECMCGSDSFKIMEVPDRG
jgi:hypothetical protein